jgi:uncharacterized protein (TIGR00725 family)
MQKTVTIFGSSRVKEDSPEYIFAYELGKLLGKNGYRVCNGGYGGIMEASAKGAREEGSETIGVICEIFYPSPNKYIKKSIMTKVLFERLQKLIDYGDAYIVLKGGTGTLLEISAVWEMINKGMILTKPIIAVSPFWEPLIDQFKVEMAWEGNEDCTKHVRLAGAPEEVLETLNIYLR